MDRDERIAELEDIIDRLKNIVMQVNSERKRVQEENNRLQDELIKCELKDINQTFGVKK